MAAHLYRDCRELLGRGGGAWRHAGRGQRIKALETYLGIDLFQRFAQGVRLTEAGKRYGQRLAYPLEVLGDATREIALEGAVAPVRVAVNPALGQLSPGPRMHDFHRRHPNTPEDVLADAGEADVRTSSFDVVLRCGRPPFPGCDSRPLLRNELVPVVGAGIADEIALDDSGLPRELPLIADSARPGDFHRWLQHAGARRDSRCGRRLQRLRSFQPPLFGSEGRGGFPDPIWVPGYRELRAAATG